jgi:small-conductance mechanosensitive channel
MSYETGKIMEFLENIKEWFVRNVLSMQVLVELGIIVGAYISAFILAVVIRKALGKTVLRIRRKYTYLSVPLKLVMDHLTGSFFPVILLLVSVFARLFDYNTYLIKTVAVLSLIILVVDLVSHLIENKLLSKFISYTISAVIALRTFDVYQDVVKFLDSASFELGEVRLSPYFVLKGLFVFGIVIWIASLMASGLNKKLKKSETLTPSLKVLTGKTFSLSIYFIAVIIGLNQLGINLTAFAVFGGAVGVGIGFGLQKVFSNLVSGFIILMDSSIRPGDIIQLDDKFGTVNHLGGRYISVTAWDGTEYLIPNEDIVTGRVINWTHSNRNILISLEFGVSYNSDVHKVRELILKATHESERVSKSPAPSCFLKGFGDNSVNFTLFCWISDPENGMMGLKSEINFKVWDLFKQHNIEIPFPQRDIHIRSDNTKKDNALS